MRVIAGELKGQRLVAPRGWKVRPTSDRVREAVFSALGDVTAASVLDLFCGTGALAIEALSRGDAGAVLVDRDTRPALGNVERLGLGDRVELVRSDALRWLESQSAPLPVGRFDHHVHRVDASAVAGRRAPVDGDDALRRLQGHLLEVAAAGAVHGHAFAARHVAANRIRRRRPAAA
jgi:SAM-dependent methyltransferase